MGSLSSAKGDAIPFSILPSMPEMAVAGEDHGDSCGIGGGDDFFIAHGAAGLDAGGDAGIDGGLQAIGEGEHGIGGDDGAFEIETGFFGFPDGDARAVDAAHLSGTDAERAIRCRIDDGVGLDVFHDAPGEAHGTEFFLRRRAFGDDFFFQIIETERGVVAVHDHDAAGAGANERISFRFEVGLVHFHDAQIFFLLQQGAGSGFEIGRDDDIGENFRDHAGEGLGERAVDDDDAAEGCLAVGLERFLPSGAQVFIVLTDAAGIGVLEDADGGTAEIEDKIGGGLDVEHVGVAEFLALDLREAGAEIAVECGFLVRVVAVAEFLIERQADGEVAAGAVFALAEVVGDGGIVLRGTEKYFHGQFLAQGQGGVTTVFHHLLQHARVVLRVGDDGDAGVVFRSTAQHRGAADVDVFDGFFQCHAFALDGLLKRIEIDDHEVDGGDGVLGGLGLVLGIVAFLQEATVDFRVESFHAALEKFGCAGVVGDIDDGEPDLAQGLGGAAGGEEFDAEAVKTLSKFDQARLVRYR